MFIKWQNLRSVLWNRIFSFPRTLSIVKFLGMQRWAAVMCHCSVELSQPGPSISTSVTRLIPNYEPLSTYTIFFIGIRQACFSILSYYSFFYLILVSLFQPENTLTISQRLSPISLYIRSINFWNVDCYFLLFWSCCFRPASVPLSNPVVKFRLQEAY